MVIARMLRRVAISAALMLAGLAVLAAPEGTGAAEKKSERVVALVDIKGPIGPATSDYFSRAMEKARAMGATAIVVRMDTPGGLSTSMRDIIPSIPVELDQVVLRSLEKSPKERFTSAKSMLDALDKLKLGDTWTQKEAALWWQRVDSEMAQHVDTDQTQAVENTVPSDPQEGASYL